MRALALLSLLQRCAAMSYDYETNDLPRCSMGGNAGSLPKCTHGLRHPSAPGKGMGGKCNAWVEPYTVDYSQLLANLTRQKHKLVAPAGSSNMMNHVQMARRKGSGGMGGGSAVDAMELLEHSLLWLAEQRPGVPIRSLETGFALGYSAMSIVGAACQMGFAVKHTAMDPFQSAWWKGLGQKNMKDTASKCASNEVAFEHLELPAVVGLARMYEKGECVQLAYMDDGHRFDDNMVELHLINAMMPAGGILVIDDTLMPSVAATITYIEANLPYLRFKISQRFVAFVKWKADKRSWSHFGAFHANFTAGFGKHRNFVHSVADIVKHRPPFPRKAQQPGVMPELEPDADAGPTPNVE